MKHTYLFLALLALLMPGALAEGLTAVSPVEGATTDPVNAGFQFGIPTKEVIKECSLLIDGEAVKTVPYNSQLVTKQLTYTAEAPDGNHTWSVECTTATGKLSTPTRAVVIQNAQDSGVKVVGSGIYRGSMEHQLTLSPGKPVVVPKISAGDVIAVTVRGPTKSTEKVFYLRNILAKDGKQYLRLEDLKKATEIYYINAGENVTINTTPQFTVMFNGTVRGKAVIIVYPSLDAAAAPTEAPEVDDATNGTAAVNETKPGAQPAVPATPPTPQNASPSERENKTSPAAEPAQPAVPAEKTPEAPKQGFFKRVLGWFSGVFG